MIVSPGLGAAYLGTQGDEWDSQENMFLAFSGAIIAMIITAAAAREHRFVWH